MKKAMGSLWAPLACLVAGCATMPPAERPTPLPTQDSLTYSKHARLEVHAIRWGASRERLPVVLLHPWAADHRIWDLIVPALAKVRPVLVIDLPGHGASGHPPGRYPPRRLAAAVLDVMNKEGVARAVLVGNSLGGATAIELGLTAPERAFGLVLAGAPGGAPVPEMLRAFAKRATAPRALSTVSVPSLRLAIRLAARSASPGVNMLIEDMIEARTSSWLSSSEAMSSALEEVMRYAPPLESLHLPVLVTAGEDDAVVPLAAQRALAERIPGAALMPLEDCGHFPEVDCPDAFLAALEGFLARLEGAR